MWCGGHDTWHTDTILRGDLSERDSRVCGLRVVSVREGNLRSPDESENPPGSGALAGFTPFPTSINVRTQNPLP